ncbi:MAG: TolC family protein [Cyanobacteria bacterium HKST-UBA04]|nr:TolC family protein [Cyanobacteria bacterium HKST-UBA04]
MHETVEELSLEADEPQAAIADDTTLGAVSVEVLKSGLSKTVTSEFTLEEALAMALEANLAIKRQEAVTRQAKAQYYTKMAALLPDIETSFSRDYFHGPIQIFGNRNIDISRQIEQPALLFRFPVFRGGRDFFQMRAAKHSLNAQQAVEAGQQQAVLQQTAAQFYELKRQLAQVKIAQKQRDEVEETLRINEARMEAGLGTRLEVAQTKAQLATAKAAVLTAIQAAQFAALALNETLNLPAIVDVVPANETDLTLKRLITTDKNVPELVAVATENRQEIQALDKEIAALKQLRRIALSAILPEVTVEVGVGLSGPTVSRAQPYDSQSYGATMKFTDLGLPVLTGLKQNSAQIDEKLALLEAQHKAIEKEIAQAWLDTQNKEALVEQAHAQIEAAALAQGDALARLKLGVGRNIDVLDAETRLNEARQNYVAAVMQYNQAHVNLVFALGLASVDALTHGVAL